MSYGEITIAGGQDMAASVVLDNEYATLWFHEDSKIVHHKFKKYIHGEMLRQLLTKGYETLKQKNAKRWLSDDRGGYLFDPPGISSVRPLFGSQHGDPRVLA